MNREEYLRHLAGDAEGAVIVGNICIAHQDGTLDRDDLVAWIDRAIDLVKTEALNPRHAAWHAVWRDCERFHRKGGAADMDPAEERLVVFSTHTKIISAINDQAADLSVSGDFKPPPTGPVENLIAYIQERKADEERNGTRRLKVFDPRRLTFYTRAHGDLNMALEELYSDELPECRTDLSERILRLMGLQISAGQQWLMTTFSQTSSTGKLTRPTPFDAINGAYFKQRRVGGLTGEWGTTANLNRLVETIPVLCDGAAEAVGDSLAVTDVVDCFPLPLLKLAPHPSDSILSEIFTRQLLAAVDPEATSWDRPAAQLAAVL